MRLGSRHRFTLHAASTSLFISGAAWAWANHLDLRGQAGESLRALKPWLLKIHGFSAMGFVFLLGMLFANHIVRGWRSRRNRLSGAVFFKAVAVLTLSGYALYYIGGEDLRNLVSAIHLWLGVGGPALLAWHIGSGRRLRRF